jgi:hypothetical protein
MDVKVEAPAYRLEHIEFCQARPVFVQAHGGYIFVRNVAKCLAADACGVRNFQTDNGALRTLKAIGVCGGILSRGLPCLQPFYATLRGLHRKLPNLALDNSLGSTGLLLQTKALLKSERMMIQSFQEKDLLCAVSVETRVSFWEAFGITPTEQEIMEAALGDWEPDKESEAGLRESHQYREGALTRVEWENISHLI